MAYPQNDPRRAVPAAAVFPEIEQRVLAHWDADKTFAASVEGRPAGVHGDNEYVFYDGPPFANGLPHYGHLLTGYVKDLVPRYQTMRGRRVMQWIGHRGLLVTLVTVVSQCEDEPVGPRYHLACPPQVHGGPLVSAVTGRPVRFY